METLGYLFGFLIFSAIIALLIYVINHKRKGWSNRSKDNNNRFVPRLRAAKSAEQAGEQGERTVQWYIGQTVEGEQYVLNDYILSDGRFSNQIDHIVVNARGVFVIETKNYAGYVFGTDEQKQWTQVKNFGAEKISFYNPVMQNATHVNKIKRIVGKVPVHSLVVFVQNNTDNIKSDVVIPLVNLKTRLNAGESVLDADGMKKIFDKLVRARSDISDEEHVANLLQRQQDIHNGICPVCGGKLVLRHGKYGDFYGCSNYPRCKFKTKNID